MIDTHAHLNFKAFKQDYAQVIERSFSSGIEAIINVGSNLATSQKAIEIAGQYKKGVYAAIGLHPIHVTDEEFNLRKFYSLILDNKKIVAIGETGLDYYHITHRGPTSPVLASRPPAEVGPPQIKNLQKEIFIKHLQLAEEVNLPVILHCRDSKENPKDAYLEMLKILAGQTRKLRGVIHCFSADWSIAQRFLQLGLYIGFTGPITFKNATPELLDVVKKAPLDRILTETDCPFLAPEPFRGQRNEPAYVKYMAEKIAEIKNLSFEKIDKITTANAKKLFGLE